jgi:quercetin dioxygenase-like cupin family protein
MIEPIIGLTLNQGDAERQPIAATGSSLVIAEWRGSGPNYLHVHHADDEAWHILEGTLRFRFPNREVDAVAGTTVFVPAGLPHSYTADESARYLIIMTPRLNALIAELHRASSIGQHGEIMRRYQSEIME